MHRNREILIVLSTFEISNLRRTRWEIFLQRKKEEDIKKMGNLLREGNFSQYLDKTHLQPNYSKKEKYLKSKDRFAAYRMIRHWNNWSVWIEGEQVKYEYSSNIQVISK